MSSATAALGRSRGSVAAAIRPAPLHWRIKLYELEDQGAWIDKGTGFVHCKVVNELGGPALVIRSEENDGVIFFQSKIQTDDVYEIQGDNIIMWREPDGNGGMGVDYALSFQETSGCSAIWEEIASVQRQYLLQARALAAERAAAEGTAGAAAEHVFAMPDGPPHGQGLGLGLTGEGAAGARGGFGIGPILSILELSRSPTNSSCSNSVATSQGYGGNGLLLVLPSLSSLEEEGCLARLRYKLENLYPAQREFAVGQLLSEEGAYMEKLFRMFDGFESKGDLDSLKMLADIFRAILLLNSPDLLEHLIGSDKAFRGLCGVMEYDRTLRERGGYREFMFAQSRYREVVPLDSGLGADAAQVTELRSGCTVLFRLRYVRDIILHPKIDDPGITAIGSMISFSSSEICAQMLQNTAYMVRVLKVVWPDLNIDQYLPAAAHAPAPSGSQTVSPCHEGPQPEPAFAAAGVADGDVTAAGEEMEVVVGPTPAVVRAVAAGSSSPVVTPPLGSPTLPASPANSSASPSAPGSPSAGPTLFSAPEQGSSSRGVSNLADRPIDGLRFLRELFAMSKFLQVEKRVELFHGLFERLHEPLFLVINRVLVDCRGGPATGSAAVNNGTCESSAMETGGAQDSALAGGVLFLPEEQSEATQVVGEVLTALCIVCSPLLRKVVLGNPIPSVNPLSGHANGAAGAAGAAVPAGALTRQTSGSSQEGGKRLVTPRPSAGTASAVNTSATASKGRWWEHNTLFLLIDGIVNSPDSFSIQSFGDVLKLVLDLEKAPSAAVKNDNYRFLTSFYDNYLSFLLVPYLESLDPACPVPASFYASLGVQPHQACAKEGSSCNAIVQPFCAVQASRRLIFETLVQCVTAHSYRFKYYAMRNSILSKLLTKSFQQPSPEQGQAWLHLLGLKFVKAVISGKDEFYYKHLEKLDLLRHMMLMFREIAHKDNLVTACFLDVVEDIRSLGVKNLVLYVVDRYSECFAAVRYQTQVFERLKVKYEQIKDRSLEGGAGGQAGGDHRYLTGARGGVRQQRTFSDFDEDDYFFSGNDDDAGSQSSGGSGVGEDSHRDKRYKGATTGLGGASGAIASIVSGAFVGSDPPQSNMTSQNIGNHLLHRWAVASGAAAGSIGSSGGGGGRNLQRTNSLGKGGLQSRSGGEVGAGDSNSVSSASSASSRSTTASLRGSLLAMLGSYGIEDAGEDDEEGEALTSRNIAKVSTGAGSGLSLQKVTSIYDDEDVGDKISELSDCMSMSEEGSPPRDRTGSLDSNGSDPFAGSDFVRGSRSSSDSPPEPQLEGMDEEGAGDGEGAGLGQEGMEEPPLVLPLPPLRSKFDYEEEDSSFVTALSAGKSAPLGVATAASAATGASAGHISFSLKKKPVS